MYTMIARNYTFCHLLYVKIYSIIVPRHNQARLFNPVYDPIEKKFTY